VHLSGSEGLIATVSRRDSCSSWAPVETTTVDESGLVAFQDQDLYIGHSEGYRIAVQACGRDTVLQEAWFEIPSLPGFIATQATLTSATVDQRGAHLTWRMQSGPISVARIYRRDFSPGTWLPRGQQMVSSGGVIHFDDIQLRPGWGYTYALGLSSCGQERMFEGSFLRAPALTYPFTLRGSLPNPAHGKLTVSFSLATADPATLQVFDLGGRLVLSRSLDGWGPGDHTLDLNNLRPGLYMIHLAQAGRTQTLRSILLP
jgi:type IX secretion system substrate protein